MKRTALIAAVAAILPLAAGALTANADPFHRDGGMYRPGGYVMPVGPQRSLSRHDGFFHRPHFDHSWRYWRPLPPWRRWSPWR